MQLKFSPLGQTGHLGVRSQGQVTLNFTYSQLQGFLCQTFCSHTLKILIMSEGIFILSPGSCLSGRTWGCWGIKNWSVGICNGALSTGLIDWLEIRIRCS